MSILIFGIGSCKAIEVKSIDSNIVYSGISTGNNYLISDVYLTSKRTFSIEKVLFDNNSVFNFSIQNLNTKLFVNHRGKVLPKGDYKLIIKSDYKELKNDIHNVVITIISNEKSTIISKEVIVNKSNTIHLK